jgi:hypothetical protein
MTSPLTPNSTTVAYLPVADFLARCDQRVVADLVSDTGAAVSTASLSANANLLAVLFDACGILETALLRGNRYQPSDLANLLALSGALKPATVPNAGQALVYRLLTDLTMSLLYDRRTDLVAPERLVWVGEFLEKLAQGERILPFVETQAAGVLSADQENPNTVENRNLTSYEMRDLYGRRNNRSWGPVGGGSGGAGWPWTGGY